MQNGGLELTVVMPTYNEEAVISDVVKEWTSCLKGYGINYEFLIYDDGSQDRTLDRLSRLKNRLPQISVYSHQNRGHGPTLLRGYREAQGKWILQVDSDGEISSENFGPLWENRHNHDFLVGVRHGRKESLVRRCLTRGAELVVRLLFRSSVNDVNCPLRLMRRSRFIPYFAALPEDIFAPNVILSGFAGLSEMRIFEHPVKFQPRRAGESSLSSGRLLKGACQALTQTASIRCQVRKSKR